MPPAFLLIDFLLRRNMNIFLMSTRLQSYFNVTKVENIRSIAFLEEDIFKLACGKTCGICE